MLIVAILTLLLFAPAQVSLDENYAAMLRAEAEGDWERVRSEAREALDLAAGLPAERRAREADGIALAHHGLARALHGLGDPEGALAELERGLETPSVGHGFRSLLLSRRAFLYLDLGLPDLAQAPADAAVQASLEDVGPGGRGNKAAFGNAFLIQAQQRVAVELYGEACGVIESFFASSAEVELLEHLEKARRRSLEGSFLALKGATLLTMADGDQDLLEEARETLLAAFETTPERERFAVLAYLASLELIALELDAAAEWIALLTEFLALPGNPPATQDQLVWLAVLEAKLAKHKGTEARDQLALRLDELIVEWREVERGGGIGVLRYRHLQRAVGTLVSLSTPEEALEYVARTQRMGILWRELGEAQTSAAAIRAELTDETTGCLVIVQGGEEVYVIAFDSEDIVVEEVGSISSLLPRARRLVASLGRDPTASKARQEARLKRIDETASQLGALIFPKPIQRIARNWTHLRIVGREFLYGLPLELLLFAGEPLGIRFALSDLPSLPIGWSLVQRRKARPELSPEAKRRAVLVGMPTIDPATPKPLSTSRLETIPPSVLTTLRRSAGDFRIEAKTAREATVAALAKDLGNEASLLHILAHGASETGRELQRVIALAPDTLHSDGLLRIETARGYSFPEVVLLSVCRAARGAERIGDPGASHFGGSALLAGAATAIIASGDLRLPVAVEFSKWVYPHLSAGLSPAEALQRARKHLRESAEFSDPADWGTTYCYGLGK